MTRTIAISVTTFIFITGIWCVNLVCDNPLTDRSLDPLSPVNLTVVSR
jgi:hypothetical protein